MISYFFPPLGMGGVQRMAKLAKYLPAHGYDVDAVTVKPINYPAYDATLLDELPGSVNVYRTGSRDPSRLAKLLHLPVRKGGKLSQAAKRGGKLWPDLRIGWKKYAVREARKLVARNKYDVMLSTSPPITAHLVAMEVADEFEIPWVADFRDPWESEIPERLYDDKALVAKSYELLGEIARKASAVTRIHDRLNKAIFPDAHTIMGGYDEADFEKCKKESAGEKFVMCFMGTAGPYGPLEPLLRALKKAMEKKSEIRDKLLFRIIGANDGGKLPALFQRYSLADKVEISGYLPHREALKAASEAVVLLMSLPEEYPDFLSGKIFDYLPLPGAILAAAPEHGAAAKVIEELHAGIVISAAKTEQLADAIVELNERHQNGQMWEKGNISIYSRKNMAAKFAQLFDQVHRA